MNVIGGFAGTPAGPGAVRLRCAAARDNAMLRTAGAWLALQALALWPHARWAWQRMHDGSDEPLGGLALAAAALVGWRIAPQLRDTPQPAWLHAAVLLTVAATAALWLAPQLLGGVLAVLALACAAAAWWPAQAPRAAWAGLLLLALPLWSSLQFYAGHPLRVLTAQLSTCVLRGAGMVVERSGTAMTVQGRLVLVDAPCAGLQMAWLAYFCACAAAAWPGPHALRERDFLRRLPWVGALVLAGNVLRNSVLVALEARPQGLAPWLHQAIGALVLALVCAPVLLLMRPRSRP